MRNPNDESYLLKVAKDNRMVGLHAIVKSGAMRALGKYGGSKALEYLRSSAIPGRLPEKARRWAVWGLAQNQSEEDLETFLRDTDEKVRLEAVRGLLRMGKKSPAVDAAIRTLALQFQPDLLNYKVAEKKSRDVSSLLLRAQRLELRLSCL